MLGEAHWFKPSPTQSESSKQLVTPVAAPGRCRPGCPGPHGLERVKAPQMTRCPPRSLGTRMFPACDKGSRLGKRFRSMVSGKTKARLWRADHVPLVRSSLPSAADHALTHTNRPGSWDPNRLTLCRPIAGVGRRPWDFERGRRLLL